MPWATSIARAPETRRAPVQVLEGNFNRMSGVCPWWDSVKAQR